MAIDIAIADRGAEVQNLGLSDPLEWPLRPNGREIEEGPVPGHPSVLIHPRNVALPLPRWRELAAGETSRPVLCGVPVFCEKRLVELSLAVLVTLMLLLLLAYVCLLNLFEAHRQLLSQRARVAEEASLVWTPYGRKLMSWPCEAGDCYQPAGRQGSARRSTTLVADARARGANLSKK